MNLAIYSIKWARDTVGVPDPTKDSLIKSLREAARRKASRPVHRKNFQKRNNDLMNKSDDCNDILSVRNMLMILFGLIL